MFSTIAEMVLQLFLQSPVYFVEIANAMVAFINTNNLIPFVFLIVLAITVVQLTLEGDLFEFMTTLVKIAVLFIVISFVMARWTTFVPQTGESLSASLNGIVAGGIASAEEKINQGNGTKAKESDTCKFKLNEISGWDNPDLKASLQQSAQPITDLCKKIEFAFDKMTTPITTSAEFYFQDKDKFNGVNDDVDQVFGGG